MPTTEDEDMPTTEDEVASITTDFFHGIQNRINYNSYSNYNQPQIQESTNQEHIAETAYSKKVCYICGYPNRYARYCNQRRPANRNQQIPYQTAAKNE